jgi:hypothetical protein
MKMKLKESEPNPEILGKDAVRDTENNQLTDCLNSVSIEAHETANKPSVIDSGSSKNGMRVKKKWEKPALTELSVGLFTLNGPDTGVGEDSNYFPQS